VNRRALKICIFALLCLLVGGKGVAAQSGDSITLNVGFQSLRQGQIGLVTVGGANLAYGIAYAMDREYGCYPVRDGVVCVLAAAIDQPLGDYSVSFKFFKADGSSVVRATQIKVAVGGFASELFTLPGNLNYLLRDDIQFNEDDRLQTIYSILTPTRYWEGQFVPPVPNPAIVSGFGVIRTYTNNGSVRRHTGIDLRAGTGTPVLASASGRVALSRPMDIHGNNVIIDHGWGIYSEYAHLSQRYVVPGQFVLQGDVIGLSGNTGRSTGPHIHWEIAVGGTWVNPIDFYKIRLPQ